MGKAGEFTPVKLFCGFIFSREDCCNEAEQAIGNRFSVSDLQSDTIPFTLTSYYDKEMGIPLFRRFIACRDLIDPAALAEIKQITNDIENSLAIQGKRTVNIDPGYLSRSNVILATTKDYYHRIPLQNGIFADMEYIFIRKKINLLPWTYPDFKQRTYTEFFTSLLEMYNRQLRRSV